jgi:hypothetical protein
MPIDLDAAASGRLISPESANGNRESALAMMANTV